MMVLSSLLRSASEVRIAIAILAVVVLCLGVGQAVQAQIPLPPPATTTSPAATTPATTIAVDVKVVTLPVTVRDKHGMIVRDLTKDDFTLTEDGRPQTVKYFSQD